ncbi:glycosyltransferase family 9 protein [Nocardia farcinica]|uniref:ADP-heptose--LPS heptosyltransferase 2 n=1 Tax=Nocardia farcinica TaxID=37329 RepID=A0A0H5NHZ7_NOCFR|nr:MULTISPECIES: glycosyltransferase family 9 protein [Nocardia]AXK84468.1 glycosyltransferase family 9 protein [Nocardia farcinica]MBA4856432.1 glycosyltransferase family 9 protein [Nocardia farcinica]MBC9814258.1 glycosyltransferase family 9 protein [Nocardia farcinica]MBF6069746.1 glycosyltransferase family 9 protein [Nocardia farcinica]MBF6139253.1 glycosyltransferase family 9 protein [Nocardia farcinica]
MAVVLVLQARGLGDLLTAVPALRALRRAKPSDHIVLAAPQRLKPIVDLIASVDTLVPTPSAGALRWDGPGPDLAVNLHGPGPESIAELARLRPGRILSYRHAAFPEVDGPEWEQDMHYTERWCHLLESDGIVADRRNLGLVPPVATTSHRDCVVVHVGAGAPARRWPPDRFAAVVRHLLVLGRDVVLTGDEFERDIALTVAARAGLPRHRVLAGEQNLIELAATVAEASLVVSGDTGVAHLATAFGTRTVLMFGPTPPHWAGPPPHLLARHAVLWAGQLGDPFADTPDPGLLKITVPDVMAAIDKQLSRRPWPGTATAGQRAAGYRQVG